MLGPMRLPVVVLLMVGACAEEVDLIPPKMRIADIGAVTGDPIEAPATARVGTPFVVQVTSVGCDLAYGGADIEGVDLTPYELYFDPPRYDCTKDMMELTTLHHAMQLRFDMPGIRTLWIHVLRDGEIVHIPVDVDAQP